MKVKYGPSIVKTAREHFVYGGFTFDEIAELDGMPSARQLRRWADENNWIELCPVMDAETRISRRINLLTEKEDKTDKDLKELDCLCKNLAVLNQSKFAPAKKQQAHNQDHSTNNDSGNHKKKRKKKVKNDCSGITKEMLDELKEKLLYPHQMHWFDNQDHRTRFLLKPRQIGATFYFSFEAFYDAVVNGNNKIFISASRDQAEIFKANIVALCKEHFDVDLSGSPLALTLADGKTATLYFKSTNARTAQSASGDLYVDEVFWIPKFKELRGLAQAMATHKKYRITYFSTPSVTSHEAYELWTGKWFKKTMACNDPAFEIDISYQNLKDGRVCDDGIYRQMLNVVDVVKSGFDRINIELLKKEYSKDEFNNLFMGKFIDDAHSAFSMKELMACIGNSEKWKDFNKEWERPFAMKPVLIGFDPARTIDKATVVVLSCPLVPGEKFRLLETLDLTGNNFEVMANAIKELTIKYNVQHIGVDTTGIGYGVFDLIQNFYPMAMPIHYNPIIKNKLVIKASNVINNKRFEFDEAAVTVAASFINIRKKVVGDQITYATNRTASTGHADIAWAIMHAMIYEPLSGDSHSSQTTIGLKVA
ncbi:terminase [Pseudoalteromonas sp. NBT06-2]|uniref:terminase large subunit domain-containing protein n=1 Tax=Pseudoalteromonas sp. NBT06-2 TaxID=2025950 RepID=UPI000BA4EA3F|nr:terminase family protein [Pseudoalteromonas sp. NBT06-2]PAJ72252.1 terminase [Pseudoalteromonas sp. NBT06-2]